MVRAHWVAVHGVTFSRQALLRKGVLAPMRLRFEQREHAQARDGEGGTGAAASRVQLGCGRCGVPTQWWAFLAAADPSAISEWPCCLHQCHMLHFNFGVAVLLAPVSHASF